MKTPKKIITSTFCIVSHVSGNCDPHISSVGAKNVQLDKLVKTNSALFQIGENVPPVAQPHRRIPTANPGSEFVVANTLAK